MHPVEMSKNVDSNVHTQELTPSYTGPGNNIQIETNDNTKKGLRTEATHEHQATT
jgi:hypothetical protein